MFFRLWCFLTGDDDKEYNVCCDYSLFRTDTAKFVVKGYLAAKAKANEWVQKHPYGKANVSLRENQQGSTYITIISNDNKPVECGINEKVKVKEAIKG